LRIGTLPSRGDLIFIPIIRRWLISGMTDRAFFVVFQVGHFCLKTVPVFSVVTNTTVVVHKGPVDGIFSDFIGIAMDDAPVAFHAFDGVFFNMGPVSDDKTLPFEAVIGQIFESQLIDVEYGAMAAHAVFCGDGQGFLMRLYVGPLCDGDKKIFHTVHPFYFFESN